MLSVPDHPRKIISLVPSQTELLYALGLSDEVCGITRFCIHPGAWHQSKTRIGGTKNPSLSLIRSLEPDLILANKEENRKEDISELEKDFPVWVSDCNDLRSALDMINEVGMLVNKQQEAQLLTAAIESSFSSIPLLKKRPRTAYLIWKDPWMSAGGDTFIHAMLEAAGFENLFRNAKRYPVTSPEELMEMGCEMVLLSSEPYPFRDKHILQLQEKMPGVRISICDGEIFSWYGSRLLLAPAGFLELRKKLDIC